MTPNFKCIATAALLGLSLNAPAMSWAQPPAPAAASDQTERDVLLEQLRFVIPDEIRRVAPKVLAEFVGRYQQRAIKAGVDDIDRQTQYVLVALTTSGNGVERPEVKAIMAHPPASSDAFHAAMMSLPQSVWDSGKPLWETAPAR